MVRALLSRLSYANVAASLALFVALAGSAYAVGPGSDVQDSQAQSLSLTDRQGRFHGCFTTSGPSRGALRVVTPSARCRRGEQRIRWNQRGRPGQRGLRGSDAQFNGAVAGGALTGTFPSPMIAAGAVGPAQHATLPAVRATHASASVLVGNDVAATLPVLGTPSTFDFDTDELHDPAGANPERLTVRTPGTYLVYAIVEWAASSAGVRELTLRQNRTSGFSSRNVSLVDAAAQPITQSGLRLVRMQAGDYLTVQVRQTSGGNLGVSLRDFGAAWLGP